MFPKPQCDYRPGAHKSYGRKTRPDGSTYSFPILAGGERCSQSAIITKKLNGKLVNRCLRHQNATY